MIRAFLIGAGATKAQFPNAPLSNDFFEKLSAIDNTLFDAINHITQPYIERDIRSKNIEDIMIESYEFPLSQQQQFLANIYHSIYRLLTDSTFDNSITDYYAGPETLFKTLLNDKRLTHNDFFMTLNYDLYLDREIYSVLGKIDYGINIGFINSKGYVNLSDQNEFSIYHLHGSLNWRYYPDIVKINIDTNAFTPRYTRGNSNLCIAPPGKKELNPVLLDVWKNAEQRLLNADELIIIGCSLNPNDSELIQLINKFKKSKGIDKIKIIYHTPFITESLIGGRVFKREFENPYKPILQLGINQLYPYGFDIRGPEHAPKHGAIEFIFKDLKEK